MKKLLFLMVFVAMICLTGCVKYCNCTMPNSTTPIQVEADLTEDCSSLSDYYGNCE